MGTELGNAVVSGVASKVAESVFDHIRREISYVFKYKSYIEDLKNQVKDLAYARERVEHSVDYAKRQGEEIEKDVEQWLIRVNEFTERVGKSIIENEEKAKKRCFKGLFPNLMRRYSVNKKAVKATKDGVDLLAKGNFSNVSYRLQGTNSIYVRGYEAFDSRMPILQEIMEALKDANVNMIGVYGMAGVGKTTLAKRVALQAKEDKLFDEVVMVEVTESLDLKKIQGEIADQLGLVFQENSESGRANRLHCRLKKEKGRVLVILDNIWAKLDLDAVGIPLGYDEKECAHQKEEWKGVNEDLRSAQQKEERKGVNDDQRRCKILLTSRSHDVLRNEMDTQKNFLVETLSYTEAMNLFEKIVGNSTVISDFQPLAVEIVKKCAGLPLAIKTIANALKNKSLFVWRDALDQLRRFNPRCVPNMDETLYSTIELSYNLLRSDEAKSLFLLCGMCMVGNRVHFHDLLGYSVGLGLFGDADTLERGRNRFHTLIDYLKTSCLLLEGDTADWVKMHDITFAVALSIASSHKLMFNIPHVSGLKELLEEKMPKESTAISLLYRDINELPKRLDCPKLELFLLFMKDYTLQIPELFFEGMKELKVLDLTGICLLSLPSSLGCLKNLRTLFLDNCLLRDVAIVGELKKLEILSFMNSNIEKFPGEIGQLTRLKVLDLSNCSKLTVITPNVIASLSRLEELYMGNSFVQWEVEGLNNQGQTNASLGELKRLSHLTSLYIHIQDCQTMPQDLFSEKLKCYKIFIGDKWNWLGKYETSRTFKLKLNDRNYLGHGIKTLLKATEDLYLDEMNGVKNVLYELDRDGFPHLRHLHVWNCSEFLYIIHPMEWAPTRNAFPILKSLFLHNLINLERICHGQLTVESFSKLKIIKVRECDRLKHIFSFSVAKNLLQLQEIEVIDCKNLKEIFSEESEDHIEQIQSNSKIEFTQLRSLKLQLLPQLICFGFYTKMSLISQTSSACNMGSKEIIPEDFLALFSEKLVLPSLENLTLSSVNVKHIWLSQPPVISSCTRALKSLIVEGCSGLKFLFSPSMAKSLVQLQNLEIRNCKSMEGIINTERLEGEKDTIKMTFSKLCYLELKDLPKCRRFGAGNFVDFPSLEALHIGSCPNLKKFFCSSSCVDMGSEKPEERILENCPTATHPLFDEKVALPNLETIVLSHLDSLHMIWHKQLHADSFCKLKALRVEFCEALMTVIPSYALTRLSGVEYLKITNCGSTEQVFEFQGLSLVVPLQLKQLLIHRLPKLRHIWCKNPQRFLTFANLETLIATECWGMKSLFPISIATSLKQLKHLEITSCGLEEIVKKEDVGGVPRFVFPQLTFLLLDNLPELTRFYLGLHTIDWPMLKSLLLFHCHKIKIFASVEKSHPEIPIQQPLFLLEKIIPNLERLSINSDDITCLGHFPAVIFCKVKVLDVVCFHEESAVFPFDFLQRFYSLEKLILSNSDFEVLFTYEGLDEEKNAMVLMARRNLRLDFLPRLRHIWKLNSKIDSFIDQNLQSLEVWRCQHLTCLMPSSASFKSLTTLDVWCCDGLANILACSTAKSLVQLTTMRIRECNSVTEIIASEVDNTEDEIAFCQLKILELFCLPSLTCFCSANCAFQFPCLEEVIVKQCPKLKIFSQRGFSTPRLKGVQLMKQKYQEYFWKDDLNSTIQHFFTSTVQFRNLEYLEHSEFPLGRKMEWPTSS